MILLTDLLWLTALLVPAWLTARLLRPEPTLVQAVSETLLLALTVVAVPVFTVCLLTRTYLTADHMVVGSAVVTALAGGALLYRARDAWRQALFAFSPSPGSARPVLIAAGVTLAVFMVNYDREHFQYGCINGVVMQALTAEAAGAFDPHGGEEEDAPESEDWGAPTERGAAATMDLLDVHGTGQRLGTTAIIAPMVALFDVFGFRLLYGLLPALCVLFGFRAGLHLTGRRGIALAAALIGVLNPYVLKIVILDENVMAFCLIMGSLALLLESGGARTLVLAGIAFGAALGVRHVDLPFALTAAVLIGREPRRLAAFFVPALLAAVPCALHHHYTYGSVFAHEHFVDEIFMSFPHSFLGIEFQYTGLLNWPFNETLIRTPYNPLPTVLYYPLNTLAHLGTALSAMAVIGAILLAKKRRLTIALALWVLPLYGLLAILENWMDPNKMGIIITLFPLLVVTLALGMAWLTTWKRAGIAAATTAALSAVAILTGSITLQDDARFYEKYPRVRHEAPAYYTYELSLVTTGNPLPSTYFAQQYTLFSPSERLSRLAQDYTDRRFRRPAPDIEAPGETATVTLSVDLSKPLIESLDFLGTRTDGLVIDATPSDVQQQITGLTAWEETALDALVTRNATDQVDIYLRFGADGFADVSSDRLFSLEQRERPNLTKRTSNAAVLTLQLRDGDRLRILETVSLDEVLVYVWEVDVSQERVTVHAPRKMFHN